MRSESYKILARHFANKDNVNIIFGEKENPRTDGETIYLPSEVNEQCVNPLLGALLHETAHIKHSIDPAKTLAKLTPFAQLCTNTLEDIRVDYLTNLDYNRSYDFVKELARHAIQGKEAQFRAEPKAVQVLKGLIFKSYDFNPATLYSDAQVLNDINRLEHYIAKAKSASDTWAIAKLARQLLIDLIGKDEKLTSEEQKSIQDAINKINNASDNMQANNAKHKKLKPIYQESTEEAYKLNKSINRHKSIKNKLERQLDEAKSQEEANKLAKKLGGKQNVIDLLEKQKEKASAKADLAGRKLEEAQKEFYQERETLEQAQKEATETLNKSQECTQGSDYSLNGFSALKPEALKPEVNVSLNTKPIDEVVAEALLKKKESLEINEDGYSLNTDCLAEFETAPEKIFQVHENVQDLTKVAFVLDVSGSMGEFGSEYSSMNISFNALDALMRSTKKAIEQGAPCEVSLYAFGTDCAKVSDNIYSYDTAKAKAEIKTQRYRVGGSTNILKAVNKVSADLLNEAQKRVIVVISDANCKRDDLKALANNISGDITNIYIAVNGYMHNPSVRELFGDYNITNKNNALETIGRALLSAI